MSSSAVRSILQIIADAETVRLLAIQTLITIDELVAVNNYTKSISFDVRKVLDSSSLQGRIAFVQLFSSEIGTGAVKLPAGTLYVFKADPSIGVNATALGAAGADHLNVVGTVPVVAGDWEDDANGAVANIIVDIPFPTLANVFVAFKMDASSEFNSLAGDDEILQISIGCKASQE